MKTVLFMGDSITDAGRNREVDCILGYGYATMTAGKLGCDYPGKFRFLNRGISGNRSIDLLARIKRDLLNLKPDYMSLLIGVNDVWHELSSQNGVSAEEYEFNVDLLLTKVKKELPELRIIMLEPFVLRGVKTEEQFDAFDSEVRLRAQAAKRLAEKHGLPFVPLQERLSAFAEKTSSDTVLTDGVHPTFVGHELISRALCDAFRAVFEAEEK